MERLHPAVEHLGEARHGGDVRDRQARLAEGSRRAAGRDELEPVADEAPARTPPGRSCRRPRGARGAGRAATRPPPPRRSRRAGRRLATSTAPARSSATARGSSRCSTALIRSWSVASSSPGEDRDRLLGTIGPPSSVSSTRWTVAPVTATPCGERVADRVGARERRQERRVRVEDPAARTRRAPPARRSACSRRGRRRPGAAPARASRERRRRRRRGSSGRVDPLLRRPVERRAGPVGEDEDDLAAELAARRRRVERPQVRARRPRRRPRSAPLTAIAALRVARPAEPLRGDDLADDRRARARRPAAPSPSRRRRRGDDDDHPEPAVERRPDLVVVEPAERADQPHDRRHPPAARVEPRAEVRRQRPRHVAGQPAAGDVGDPAEVVAGRRAAMRARRAARRA